MNKLIFRALLLCALLCLWMLPAALAQRAVPLGKSLNQHMFLNNEMQELEDTSSHLTFQQILLAPYQHAFKTVQTGSPKTQHPNAAYWYRIRIYNNHTADANWILEFFDQTIDSLTVYSPDAQNHYRAVFLGASRPFLQRLYQHKNFAINLDNGLRGTHVYYFRIKSAQPASVIVMLRSVSWFIHYALNEYFLFGLFYGMILVFGLYNLIMLFAMRQLQYLYYVLYNLSIGMYEMCTDGIAYQYLWPNASRWNEYAYGVALYLTTIFALLFTQSLLYTKVKAPRLHYWLKVCMGIRTIWFLICLTVNHNWFSYKYMEIMPLVLAFYTGCRILYKGYRPARFYVVGYSFLMLGFIIKVLYALELPWMPNGPVLYYSLSICFILEMIFISLAIGDKVRLLKRRKEQAQKKVIKQLQHNEQLKDRLNLQLEQQVADRTYELVQKSGIIAEQNEELIRANTLLLQQAEEISRMNVLLEQDNLSLQSSIEKVTHDRVMSAEVNYEEFSLIYPDRETCFKFLADLKWTDGYTCRKCSNTHYCSGHLPYSRRCTRCGYEESVIANTVLQNTRIPINKAFYLIFLIYSSKGKISSHKLSEILSIRQSTCWAYSTRIKKLMDERKKELHNAGHKGWSKLVMISPEEN